MPGSSVPTLSSIPRAAAAQLVTDITPCIGVDQELRLIDRISKTVVTPRRVGAGYYLQSHLDHTPGVVEVELQF